MIKFLKGENVDDLDENLKELNLEALGQLKFDDEKWNIDKDRFVILGNYFIINFNFTTFKIFHTLIYSKSC